MQLQSPTLQRTFTLSRIAFAMTFISASVADAATRRQCIDALAAAKADYSRRLTTALNDANHPSAAVHAGNITIRCLPIQRGSTSMTDIIGCFHATTNALSSFDRHTQETMLGRHEWVQLNAWYRNIQVHGTCNLPGKPKNDSI